MRIDFYDLEPVVNYIVGPALGCKTQMSVVEEEFEKVLRFRTETPEMVVEHSLLAREFDDLMPEDILRRIKREIEQYLPLWRLGREGRCGYCGSEKGKGSCDRCGAPN